MGSGVSGVKALTPDDVASFVSSLGSAYSDYGHAIKSHAIDGSVISNPHLNDEDYDSIFGELKIKKVHQMVLKTKLKELAGTITAIVPSTNFQITKAIGKTALSASPIETLAFFTHDWGINEDSCSNHDIVSRIYKNMKQRGADIWFDEVEMIGSVQKQMADGVENTQCVVVFITQRYLEKVATGDTKDNCCFEFQHAHSLFGSTKMIPVVMEARMRNSSLWKGIAGAALKGLLYIDMVDHMKADVFESKCAELYNMMMKITGNGQDQEAIASSNDPVSIVCKDIRDDTPKVDIVRKNKLDVTPVIANITDSTITILHHKGIYTGPVSNGKANGSGICKWTSGAYNGDIYRGAFIDNYRNGKGIYTWASGNKYNGEYKDDKQNGKGIYTWIDGNKYEGEWKDGKRYGKGTLTLVTGKTYVGDWVNDKFHGKGILTFASGKIQNGYFKDGIFQGDDESNKSIQTNNGGANTNKLQLSNNNKANGNILKDKRNGRGTYTYSNGDKYDGEWKDDKKYGKGIFIYVNGDKYEGEYKDDNRNGKGIYTYADGDRYEGDWKDDKRSGKGNLILSNGSRYEGEWKNDQKNGKGIYIWSDGGKYEGDWKDNYRKGKGICIYANGDKYEGEWKDNKRNGNGLYILANGDRYEGEWKDDKMNDKAKSCTIC